MYLHKNNNCQVTSVTSNIMEERHGGNMHMRVSNRRVMLSTRIISYNKKKKQKWKNGFLKISYVRQSSEFGSEACAVLYVPWEWNRIMGMRVIKSLNIVAKIKIRCTVLITLTRL